MIDIDFLVLEYDTGEPVALVEYKNEHARLQHTGHPSYQALIKLGDKAGIPVFGVRYADDFSWWKVTSLNWTARKHIPKPKIMDEYDYVSFLYGLRGRTVPLEVRQRLKRAALVDGQ